MYVHSLYKGLVGCFIKDGKKRKAQHIVSGALNLVASNLEVKPFVVLHKLSKKLGHLIELKRVQIKKNVHLIPFPIRKERRRFLFSKELLDNSTLKVPNKKLDSTEKLAEQMFSFLLKRGANYNKRELRFKQILASRSNSHFRW